MPTAPTQTFPAGKAMNINVADYEGDTLDTTEALQLYTGNGSIVAPSIDPDNNRKVKLSGTGTGSTTVTVAAPGVAGGNVLQIPVVITAPPPAPPSRIEPPPCAHSPDT